MEMTSTAFSGTFKTNFPFRSVVVPIFCFPFTAIETPGRAVAESTIVPLTSMVRVGCCAFVALKKIREERMIIHPQNLSSSFFIIVRFYNQTQQELKNLYGT
jgi:hypothetical protein